MKSLRSGWILTQRELHHWVKEPWTLVFGLLFTIMLLLVFGLLFGGAVTVEGGGDYINFLLPGMLALTMMFGVEATATAVAADSKKGVTDRLRSMPLSSVAVLSGRAGADMMKSTVELAVLIGGGLLIGWSIGGSAVNGVIAVALLLLLRLAMLWIGIYIGLAFRGDGSTAAVQVLVWPIGFLSAAIVSTESMPAWLGAAATWNPVSATATAVRELFGNPTGVTDGVLADHAIALAVAWPVVLCAMFIPLAARAYRRGRA